MPMRQISERVPATDVSRKLRNPRSRRLSSVARSSVSRAVGPEIWNR
jgi:hypothetical protein